MGSIKDRSVADKQKDQRISNDLIKDPCYCSDRSVNIGSRPLSDKRIFGSYRIMANLLVHIVPGFLSHLYLNVIQQFSHLPEEIDLLWQMI